MDWSTENLGDLYKIGSSKRVLKSQWQTSGVPFYRGREITVLSKHGEVSNELFISEELYQEYAKKHGVPATEDIVITAIGTIGNSYIVGANDRFYFKDASVLWLKKTSNVDSSFINLWLKSPLMREQLDEGNGATVDTLTIKKLQTLQVNLPPIPEQQRIVAILDQASADIEKARANAEKNLKNARELFDSSLKGIFQSRGKNWERVTLLDLLERNWIMSHLDGNHGGDYPRKDEFIEAGVPYISAKCISNSQVDMSKSKYLSEERASGLRKGIAKNGDVLFAHNATVGPVAILNTAREKIILGTSLTYYRCNKNYILPEYLAQYMISYEFTSQYTSIMRQSTRNQVPITKQREFIHVIPPINEQKEIARELVGLSDQLQQLVIVYQQKLASLDELKKSLLQKAFSGELTKTEDMVA
jgi:type I restriction enzyme S subunit